MRNITLKTIASEPSSTLSAGGPAFLRFKQKSDTGNNQTSQAPIRASTEEPVKKTFTGRSTKSNVSESPKEKRDVKFAKSRHESEEKIEHEIRPILTDRISSPLKAVQTPALKHQENPDGINSRLESDKSDIIESLGDLILRQNGLMGKKSNNFCLLS